jgi:hypothetical protein
MHVSVGLLPSRPVCWRHGVKMKAKIKPVPQFISRKAGAERMLSRVEWHCPILGCPCCACGKTQDEVH